MMDSTPHFLLVLPKRKRAVDGPKEKAQNAKTAQMGQLGVNAGVFSDTAHRTRKSPTECAGHLCLQASVPA